MTADTADLVSGFLRARGGYRDAHSLFGEEESHPIPGAILVGPEGQNQLVVVRYAESPELRMVERGVRAFCLRLDQSGTPRSVTLVLIASSLREADLDPIRRVCRVVLCEEGSELERSLRALLPLKVPDPITSLESAEQALQSVLGNTAEDPAVRRLIRAGRTSADEVGVVMQELVMSAIAPVLGEA